MDSKGMTLIELIVVIVLLGIIGLFTFQFIGSSVETYIITSNQARLLAEAKPAMERMAREIRDAESILSPAPGPSLNSINFTKKHPALDNATAITFLKSGTALYRNSKLLAENVSDFTVTNNPYHPNEITLQLTLSLGGEENVTLNTKVYPKNLPFVSESFGGAEFNGDWKEE